MDGSDHHGSQINILEHQVCENKTHLDYNQTQAVKTWCKLKILGPKNHAYGNEPILWKTKLELSKFQIEINSNL